MPETNVIKGTATPVPTVQTPLPNYIDNEWQKSGANELLDVTNPATGEVLTQVPLSPAEEVHQAATAATTALHEWRRTPPVQRIQYLFALKNLLEENLDDIARTITLECGKTLDEAKGEMRRAIENVEVACGIPTLMQGTNLEDIATGIDEFMIRQPVGVCAAIAPFNFPGDDYFLVSTLCDRLWKHLYRQTVRKSTHHDAKGVPTPRTDRTPERRG